MKILLVLSMMFLSLSIYSSEQCSIEVDYRLFSKWGASERSEAIIRSKTKEKMIKILKDKGYTDIFFFDPYLFSVPTQYHLKVRGSVEARSGRFCGSDEKPCFDESAQTNLSVNGVHLSRETTRTKAKRPITNLLTDIDYFIDPRDKNNSRVSTILNKKRLDKVILKTLKKVENCPHSIFVNNESISKEIQGSEGTTVEDTTVIKQ